MTLLSTLGSMNRKFEGYKYLDNLIFNSVAKLFTMNMSQIKMKLYNATQAYHNRHAALSRSPPPDDYYTNEKYIQVLQGCTIFLVLVILMMFVTQFRWLKVLKLRMPAPVTEQDNFGMATGLKVDEFDKLLSGEDIHEEMKTLLHRLLSLGSQNKPVQSDC